MIILGGGIAGLSAAHELAKFTDFEVHVFDAQPVFGGKAVSRPEPFSQEGDKKDKCYASEHGFRLFPHFYRHLTETLKEIPFNQDTTNGTLVDVNPQIRPDKDAHPSDLKGKRLRNTEGNVWGNLIGSTEAAYAREGKLNVVQRPFPTSVADFTRVVREMLGRDTIVRDTDVAYYAWKILKFMTSCPERREEEYERLTWGEYLGVGQGVYSEQFETLTRSVPRILSAMRPETCSARSVGNSTIQLLFDFVGDGGSHMESVLAGPTQAMWLDPWVRFLKAQGVMFWPESKLKEFEFENGNITCAHVEIQPRREESKRHAETLDPDYNEPSKKYSVAKWKKVEGAESTYRVKSGDDSNFSATYYICALPLEVMQGLFRPFRKDHASEHPMSRMLRFDRSLQQMMKIERAVAPMVGLQFYLKRSVPICSGHVFYPDSPWALTSVSQAQFWEKQLPGHLGDYLDQPDVKDILSVILSEWQIKAEPRPEFGALDPAWNETTKERIAKHTTACELKEAAIKREVWAQLKDALSAPGKRRCVLEDADLYSSKKESRSEFEKKYRVNHPNDDDDTMYAAWLDAVLSEAAVLDTSAIVEEQQPLKGAPDRTVQVFAPGTPLADFVPREGFTPLFMHPKGSYPLRPDAELRIPNLLLASDYVRTYTDLATMEAANEAAKRAVLAILRRVVPSPQGFPKLHPLTEGRWFEAAQALDRLLYSANKQPHVMDTPHLFAMLGGSVAQDIAQVGFDLLGIRRRPPPEMAQRRGGVPTSSGAVAAAAKTLQSLKALTANFFLQ